MDRHETSALVTEGHVRAAPLRSLPQVLQGFGVALPSILGELGLPSDLLDDPENLIAVSAGARILALSAERACCPHIGLLVGQQASFDVFGLVGRLVLNEPDVGTALRSLIRIQHLHGRAGVPALSVNNGIAVHSFILKGYLETGATQIIDLSAAIGFNLLRDLCGPDWAPTEIALPHAAPADLRPYNRCFRAPLRFDGECLAFSFAAHWLSHPVAGANPVELGRLRQTVEEVTARHGNDLITRTRRALYVLVIQGSGSMENVADLVGLHRRTLNRRLALHGTSVSRILEDVKSRIARQLLTDTTLSMIEIAAAIGYADASAFTRAFRRWEHASPSEWRSNLERRGPAQAIPERRV